MIDPVFNSELPINSFSSMMSSSSESSSKNLSLSSLFNGAVAGEDSSVLNGFMRWDREIELTVEINEIDEIVMIRLQTKVAQDNIGENELIDCGAWMVGGYGLLSGYDDGFSLWQCDKLVV
ncbi:hypothetical protein WICPIJ_002379 [Wickerhamomyces pijperi]|uniref:Uncharacterized protein n=1 Tax=Wickerhamomyces pijperi TaxID=599730 RepID=A0A9P8TPW3_WICPI|nr:hypothetical protein WICPIJ_002379 [Wickerhamomyces pijperi]